MGITTVRVEVFLDDPDSFVGRAVAAGADGPARDTSPDPSALTLTRLDDCLRFTHEAPSCSGSWPSQAQGSLTGKALRAFTARVASDRA